jgi:two-component system response regulator HydG
VRAEGGASHELSPDADALLLAHRWPGNVRELENALRHGAALADDGLITPADLPSHLGAPPAPSASAGVRLCTLAEMEREHVLGVLGACDGSVVEAARVLGIGRNTLWRKLKSWG